jgi:sugar transferase (PEP-CTERM/EpsH1 system associated)
MKILWLNAGLLLPLDKGGKLRTWHLMRHLARRHEITYVSFADPGTTVDQREGMREVCEHLQIVPRTEPDKGTLRFYVDAAAHIVGARPYAVAKYASAAYRDLVRQQLATSRFDVVVCDFLVPAVNMPSTLPCPSVVFTHNVESEIWRRHWERQTNPVRRWLFEQQYRRMLAFEEETLARFDVVLAVSETDGATLERLYPRSLRRPAVAIATGVDTSYFRPTPAVGVRPHHLVFTGSMDWIPNEDAMTYFCHDILPRIRASVPDASLSIVGRSPTPAVLRLAESTGVEVTGRVEDVREHVAAAAVYVVPIRIGGGTRLKIFEAMAMSKAVVSTTIGAEGLPVTHGQDVVLADTADAFADEVVALLRHPEQRLPLEQRARDLVVRHYDWAAIAGQLEDALLAARDVDAGRAALRRSA